MEIQELPAKRVSGIASEEQEGRGRKRVPTVKTSIRKRAGRGGKEEKSEKCLLRNQEMDDLNKREWSV